MMTYSFIIPVYNCKSYLSACVDSIRSMALEAYEILLVDDGSTDGSGTLCDALAEKCPEVRVIHQSNGGASSARNRGIQESRGERLLFLDADDSIEPRLLRNILLDPRCGETDLTIFGLTFDYYKNGKCYRRDPLYYAFDGIMQHEDWGKSVVDLFLKNSLSSSCMKIYKRSILQEKCILQNENMFLYEDFEFVLRYLRHCDSIWNVPQAVYHYRQSEDEGNARRRLARIDSLPVFLVPIEAALSKVRESNPAVTEEQTEQILQMLYLTLAREKIDGSDLSGTRKVCEDFRCWASGRSLPVPASQLQLRLQEGKSVQLLLASKKSALRHKLAVWVKAHLRQIK